MVKPSLQTYKKWRKRVAKDFNCTEEAVDAAVDEGRIIVEEWRNSDSPQAKALLELYRSSFSPAFVIFFTIYLYAQNPTLRLMMTTKRDGTSPFTQPIQ